MLGLLFDCYTLTMRDKSGQKTADLRLIPKRNILIVNEHTKENAIYLYCWTLCIQNETKKVKTAIDNTKGNQQFVNNFSLVKEDIRDSRKNLRILFLFAENKNRNQAKYNPLGFRMASSTADVLCSHFM